MTTLRGLVGGLVALLVVGCLAGSDGATALQNELARAPVLPGAVELFSSPTRALDDDFTDMVIDVNRWWTAPGTVDGAIAYLQSHRPVGMVAGGIGRSSGGGTGRVVWVIFTGAYPHSLDVYVTAFGDGVAVRANIQDTGRSNG